MIFIHLTNTEISHISLNCSLAVTGLKNDAVFIKIYQLLIIPLLDDESGVSK